MTSGVQCQTGCYSVRASFPQTRCYSVRTAFPQNKVLDVRAAFPCRESQPNSCSTRATPAIHWHLLCHCLAHTEAPQCHAGQAFGTSLITTIFHRKAACKNMWAQLQDTGESAATRLDRTEHPQSVILLLVTFSRS